MQQRVGLARAFAMDTDILLMDEPFSALDPLIRAQLQDELILLQNKLNKTILFVSHDLDEALKIGNNIAIMESGELIQHGKPEDIVLNPKNDYVKDFVAHTNPLNVLRGRSLMQPADSLTSEENRWQICETRQLWVEQNQDQIALANDDLNLHYWNAESTDFEAVNDSAVVVAHPDIEMRDAIELKMRSQHPVLLAESTGLSVSSMIRPFIMHCWGIISSCMTCG